MGKPHFVYEAWIGCGGEGFARSTDSGLHFQKPITLPDSSGSDDPAIAVAAATDGRVRVVAALPRRAFAYPVVAGLLRPRRQRPPRSDPASRSVERQLGGRDLTRRRATAARRVVSPGTPGRARPLWRWSAARMLGSCACEAVDATAVIQRSADNGKTWSQITPMQPGFPAGGGYDASTLVQPDGRVNALIWGHHLNPVTYKVHPGHEFFTSSSDAGRTWSPLLSDWAHGGIHRSAHLVDRR